MTDTKHTTRFERAVEACKTAEPRHSSETIDLVYTFAQQEIERFRQDVIDFIRLQPEHMINRGNVIGMVQNLKSEWGR